MLPVYSLYGLTVASDFPFVSRLEKGVGTPDLTFRLADGPPVTGWEGYAPVYASASRVDSGESLFYVYRQGDLHVLRCTEEADFYIWPQEIVCHLLDPAYYHMVEIYLLGFALSLWLELRGIPALHASAVVVEDRAVGFLATNRGGKSSLAATLMQAGYPLLTDDILPLERRQDTFWGRPGYPQMRMWPDQAQHFLGYYEDLDIVHPAYTKRRVPVGDDGLGVFCHVPQPLACLYIPERRDPDARETQEVEIKPILGAEALTALLGQSFALHIVEALGLQASRFRFFASLASQVPMRRLAYPEGSDQLPRVRRAIVDDLLGLSSSRR